MTSILEAVGIVVGYIVLPAILGGLLHELTHAAVVVAMRHDLKGLNLHRLLVGFRQGSTVVYETNFESRWNDLIGAAPVFIGLAAAGAWAIVAPAVTGLPLVALAITWAFYTFNISREDLFSGDVEADPRLDKVFEFLFIGGVGFALLASSYRPAEFIAWTLMAAGFVGAMYNYWRWEDAPHHSQAERVSE